MRKGRVGRRHDGIHQPAVGRSRPGRIPGDPAPKNRPGNGRAGHGPRIALQKERHDRSAGQARGQEPSGFVREIPRGPGFTKEDGKHFGKAFKNLLTKDLTGNINCTRWSRPWKKPGAVIRISSFPGPAQPWICSPGTQRSAWSKSVFLGSDILCLTGAKWLLANYETMPAAGLDLKTEYKGAVKAHNAIGLFIKPAMPRVSRTTPTS